MFFDRFKKKKTKDVSQDIIERENGYEKLHEPVISGRQKVIESCEQIIDVTREFEDARKEYALVTEYLKDIETIGSLPKDESKALKEAAKNIFALNQARNDYMKTENKISDSQFAQMQELEDDLPGIIRRLKDNEEYLDTVNRDLRNLGAEKAELEIEKEECQSEQKHLKVIAILLIVLFAAIIVLCALMRVLMEKDTSLIMMAVSFVIVLLGTYVFLRYQKCQKEIERCMLNKNHAILLENRVKIKYVNIKNAVDYSCQKYHVKNSRDLTYVYEQYQAAVIEREKFQRTSEDLEYNSEKMLSILKKHNLYDAKVWLNYANAIVNEKDMVELKHNLIVRRQKLRNRMEYNIGVITQLRATILLHRSELGDKAGEVSRLLNKIAQLTLEFEDED